MNVTIKKLAFLGVLGALAFPLALRAETTAPATCPGGGQACAEGAPACGGGMRHGGWHGRMGGGFDPKTVTTVQGKVERVQTGQGGRGHGVQLEVSSGANTVWVIVGPSFWLDDQPVKLAVGDLVDVKGARTERFGQQVIVAQEIRKGAEVLTLRDEDGVPLWARGRAR
jgi:hypothetical protein